MRVVTMLISSRRLLGQSLARVGVWACRLYYFETDLHARLPDVETDIDARVRRVPPDELAARQDEMGDYGRKYRANAIAAGDGCYFAECDGRLAGFSWVSTRGVRMGRYFLASLAEGGIYSHTGFVFPEFRGNRLFQCMLGKIYQDLRDEGYRFACNLVLRDNVASIRTREKFRPSGKPIVVAHVPALQPWVIGGPIGTGTLFTSIDDADPSSTIEIKQLAA